MTDKPQTVAEMAEAVLQIITDNPAQPMKAASEIAALFKQHTKPLEYEKHVADNCRMVASSAIPGTWTDPMSGEKLYNQAHIAAEVRAARIDELQNIKAKTIGMYYDWNAMEHEIEQAFSDRLAELQGKENQE